MSKDVVHIRANRRPSNLRQQSATYAGIAAEGGPVIPRIEDEENINGPAPTGLTLTTGALYNSSFIRVAWSRGDPDARSFEVHLERISDGNLQIIRTNESGREVTFEPVTALEQHRATVYNIYTSGQRGGNSVTGTIFAAGDTSIPAQVANLSMGAGLRTITARWDDNTEQDVEFGVGSYRVQLADDDGFASIVTDKKISGNVTSIGDLLPNTQYWLRIKAVDTSGNESASWSSTATATTQRSTGNDIEDDAIDRQHIAAAAIGTLEVEDAAITDAKIINLQVQKLRGGTITGREIVVDGLVDSPAYGVFLPTAGSPGQYVTSIRVPVPDSNDRVELLGSQVQWNTNTTTTTDDIVDEVNLNFGGHGWTAANLYTVVALYPPASEPQHDYNGLTIEATSDFTTWSTQNITAGQSLGILRSVQYDPGVAGWAIYGDGLAEFNQVTVRGSMVAGDIALGTNAWHVNDVGQMWWGAYADWATAVLAQAPRIDNTGALNMSTGTFSGSLTGATGTFGAGDVDMPAQNITAGVITGATLQTAASGARVHITTDNIRFYDTAGFNTGIIEGTSGFGNPYFQALGTKFIRMSSTNGDVFVSAETDAVTPVSRTLWLTANAGTPSVTNRIFLQASGGSLTGEITSEVANMTNIRQRLSISSVPFNEIFGAVGLGGVQPTSSHPNFGGGDFRTTFIDINDPFKLLWYSTTPIISSRVGKFEEQETTLGASIPVLPKLGKTWTRKPTTEALKETTVPPYGLIVEDVVEAVGPELGVWLVNDETDEEYPVDIDERAMIGFLWDRLAQLESEVRGLPTATPPSYTPTPLPTELQGPITRGPKIAPGGEDDPEPDRPLYNSSVEAHMKSKREEVEARTLSRRAARKVQQQRDAQQEFDDMIIETEGIETEGSGT